jgi:hypothetical protein
LQGGQGNAPRQYQQGRRPVERGCSARGKVMVVRNGVNHCEGGYPSEECRLQQDNQTSPVQGRQLNSSRTREHEFGEYELHPSKERYDEVRDNDDIFIHSRERVCLAYNFGMY